MTNHVFSVETRERQEHIVCVSGAADSVLPERRPELPPVKSRKLVIQERIKGLLETAKDADWDAQGAKPVTQELIDIALQIVNEFPGNIPMPDISATPLGYVALDWETEPDLLFSMVILPSGEVAFSCHSDKTQFHGQDKWDYTDGLSPFVRCFVAKIK